VGYSKLGKAALLSKLRELTLPVSSTQSTRPQAGSSSLNSGPSHSPLNDPPVSVPGAVPGAMGPPSLPKPLDSNKVPGTHIPQISVASIFGSSLQPPPCPSGGRGKSHSPSVSGLTAFFSKRVSTEIVSQDQAHHADPSAKRPKVATSSTLQANLHCPNSARPLGDLGVVGPPLSVLPCSATVPIIEDGVGNQLGRQTQTTATPGKRFKPLAITRPPSASPCYRNEARLSPYALADNSANVTTLPTHLWHLDFPAHPEFPLLSPITFPPPLSQRKLVQRWAIILSGLSSREQFQCCLVSRLIRYAGKDWVHE
jgi:hypothetical protein